MTSLDETRAEFLLVVARRIVPEAVALDEAGLAQMLAIIDRSSGIRLVLVGEVGRGLHLLPALVADQVEDVVIRGKAAEGNA